MNQTNWREAVDRLTRTVRKLRCIVNDWLVCHPQVKAFALRRSTLLTAGLILGAGVLTLFVMSLTGSGASSKVWDSGVSATPIPPLHISAAPTARPTPTGHRPHSKAKQPCPPLVPKVSAANQLRFVNQIGGLARSSRQQYHVPPAVTVAQAAHESDYGASYLAHRAHNLFGVKCSTTDTACVWHRSAEFTKAGRCIMVNSRFRSYPNISASLADHARLLATSGYYTLAMSRTSNPEAFAQALVGIYATDPQYGRSLINLMTRFDLFRFDR